MYIFEQLGDQVGYEKLAPTTAKGFTAASIKPTSGAKLGWKAKAVKIIPEDYPIRVREDGTSPTADEGLPVAAGQEYLIIGTQNVTNFKCIDTAAGASSVKCLFYF